MAEHLWTVLCNKTLVDPDSKVISLIDVAESLRRGVRSDHKVLTEHR